MLWGRDLGIRFLNSIQTCMNRCGLLAQQSCFWGPPVPCGYMAVEDIVCPTVWTQPYARRLRARNLFYWIMNCCPHVQRLQCPSFSQSWEQLRIRSADKFRVRHSDILQSLNSAWRFFCSWPSQCVNLLNSSQFRSGSDHLELKSSNECKKR